MATLFRRASKKIYNKDSATPTACTPASTAPKTSQAPTVLEHKNAALKTGTTKQQAGAEHQAQSKNVYWRVKDKALADLHAPTETTGMVKETFQLEVSQSQPQSYYCLEYWSWSILEIQVQRILGGLMEGPSLCHALCWCPAHL